MPTIPEKLPRPHRKGDLLNHNPANFVSEDGPLVLSPSRKLRRVTPHHGGFGRNAHELDKDTRHVGEATGSSGNIPMSIDMEAFRGSQPPPRPTLNR